MMAATATHCVALVGFGRPIIATKMIMQMVSTIADQINILRRPNRSIVHGSGYVPAAKPVAMTAASSWDKKGVSPTCSKITVE